MTKQHHPAFGDAAEMAAIRLTHAANVYAVAQGGRVHWEFADRKFNWPPADAIAVANLILSLRGFEPDGTAGDEAA